MRRHKEKQDLRKSDGTWGFPLHLDPEQTTALQSLKELVGGYEIEEIKFGIETVDSVLCRFLRARKFDVPKTYQMIAECIALRTESAAQTCKEIGPSECLGCPFEVYETFNPYWYVGFDKFRRVVMVQHCGLLDTNLLDCLTGTENIIKYHWWSMESLNDQFQKCEQENGHHEVGMTVILDLEGFGPKTATRHAYNYIQSISQIDALCYPELLGKIFIVNAPKVFSAVWKVVKSWLDPRTASKFQIFSSASSARSQMLEIIDENTLPVEYGGNAEGKLLPASNAKALHLGKMKRSKTFTANVEPGDSVYLNFYSKSSSIHLSVTPPNSSTPETMNWDNRKPGLLRCQKILTDPGCYSITVSNFSKTSTKSLIYNISSKAKSEDENSPGPFGTTHEIGKTGYREKKEFQKKQEIRETRGTEEENDEETEEKKMSELQNLRIQNLLEKIWPCGKCNCMEN